MKRYYVDVDDECEEENDEEMFYVFDSFQEPHKAISSWCDQNTANEECDKANNHCNS